MQRAGSGRIFKVSLAVEPAAEEAVTQRFEEAFAQSPAVEIDVQSGTTRVSVYLKTRPRSDASARLMRKVARLGDAQLEISEVPHENWAESWKRHFKPLTIGSRLLVRPSWSRQKPRPGQALVVLDPGLSFGTGQHPTTLFCLEEIVAGSRGSLLDLGTGSGILAIAAAKLGLSPVEAVDLDPVAVRIAKANARRNRVAHRIRFARKDLAAMGMAAPRKFDMVCANLIYDVLIAERRKIIGRLKAGGRLVLAGILARQFAAVERAFRREGLRLVHARTVNEWRSGTFDFS